MFASISQVANLKNFSLTVTHIEIYFGLIIETETGLCACCLTAAKCQERYFAPLISDIKAHINFSFIDDVM